MMNTIYAAPEGQMRLSMVHLDLEVGNAPAFPKAIVGGPYQVPPAVQDYRGGRIHNAPARRDEVVAIIALLIPLEEVHARRSKLVGLECGLGV